MKQYREIRDKQTENIMTKPHNQSFKLHGDNRFLIFILRFCPRRLNSIVIRQENEESREFYRMSQKVRI